MNIHITDWEKRQAHDLSQVESEFAQLVELCSQGRSCLEIGSLYGGSSERLAKAMPEGSRMVCVDLGYEPMQPTWRTLPALMMRLSSVKDREVHLVIGSSKNTKVHEIVSDLGPFDLVFIDGGHKLHEVASDWAMYGPLGKVVAFHDVASCKDVQRFWKGLRNTHPRHAEFIDGESAGIGVLWRS